MQPTSPAHMPSHTGILREETVALRQLLGYGRPTEASLRLSVPELGIRLSGSSIRDVLLVGLDIDTYQGYEKLIPDHQLHIGISILDTRRLSDLLVSPVREGDLATVIDSYQFTVGTSKYCRRARSKILFGQSRPAANISELKFELERLVEGRDTVLVLHGAECDLKMLRNLDINLQPLYIIDTNKAAQYPLQLYYRYGLEKLLDALDIPYALLHAAGNDSRFCLQALLMLAVKDAEREQPDASDEALLQLLQGISQAPRPPTAREIDIAAGPARPTAKAERKERRAVRREQRRLERESRDDTKATATESDAEEHRLIRKGRVPPPWHTSDDDRREKSQTIEVSPLVC